MTIIRQARPDEAPAVAGLWTQAAVWLASRGIDQWQYAPHHDRIAVSIAAGECWVAVNPQPVRVAQNSRETVVGTITVDGRADPEFWRPEDDPDAALYAHRMVAARAAAGMGLGRLLLHHAGILAAEQRKTWLRLDCWRDNPGLAAYYRAQGFSEVRTVALEHRRSGVLFQRPAG